MSDTNRVELQDAEVSEQRPPVTEVWMAVKPGSFLRVTCGKLKFWVQVRQLQEDCRMLCIVANAMPADHALEFGDKIIVSKSKVFDIRTGSCPAAEAAAACPDVIELLPEEEKVITLLAESYNAFITLPALHGSHQEEFGRAIHAAQNLVMSRPVARRYKELYDV